MMEMAHLQELVRGYQLLRQCERELGKKTAIVVHNILSKKSKTC
jgi:hypothetical protein